MERPSVMSSMCRVQTVDTSGLRRSLAMGETVYRIIVALDRDSVAIDGKDFALQSTSRRLNTDGVPLCHFRDLGRAQAERWLAATYDDIGVRSSVDVHGDFV